MLAIGASGGCLDIFSLVYHFSFLSPSLWETARYRLKFCLKGPSAQNNQLTKQGNLQTGRAFRGLTGGFLLLRNFSVTISVSPHVCFILV